VSANLGLVVSGTGAHLARNFDELGALAALCDLDGAFA